MGLGFQQAWRAGVRDVGLGFQQAWGAGVGALHILPPRRPWTLAWDSHAHPLGASSSSFVAIGASMHLRCTACSLAAPHPIAGWNSSRHQIHNGPDSDFWIPHIGQHF